VTSSLRERAQRWLEQDPDPETRGELEALLRAGADDELRHAFEPPLVFGTAGLRGAVGPGPARMNRAVVRRVAWALGQYLVERGLAERPVVVGFDARPTSETFARDTVEVLAAQGFDVLAFPLPTPTPWVAFACRALGAAAGVVVTASHNPRGDNGYKVYDDLGVQIVSPWDRRIAELMDAAPAADQIVTRAGGGRAVPDEIVEAYFAGLVPPAGDAEATAAPRLRVAYTPLHGVGLESVRRVIEGMGRAALSVVAAQAAPDGTFPTTPFPNPEEPGTVDALLELARSEQCDLALANDPDADRLAVCLPDDDGVWRRLSGDEVGVLLADHLLASGAPAPAGRVVASSVVSSPMLDAVAASHGARVERSLTGFKWLCRVPAALRPGERFVFGYEEALGYAVDPRVLDKDGISAAASFVDLALALARQGKTVAEHLRQLFSSHGLWVSAPASVRLPAVDAPQRMTRAMERLRSAPPAAIAGLPVTAHVDYARGAEHRAPHLGAQDLVQLELGAGAAALPQPELARHVLGGRVLVRPSGTEPKVKLYVHLRGAVPDGASAAAWREARARLEELGAEVAQALATHLGFT
jgi:phosphomannomutase